jgi:hypothetical protein
MATQRPKRLSGRVVFSPEVAVAKIPPRPSAKAYLPRPHHLASVAYPLGHIPSLGRLRLTWTIRRAILVQEPSQSREAYSTAR